MRVSQAQPQLLSLLLLTLSHSSPVAASPLPQDELYDLGLSYLMERTCAIPCGADSQYCCNTGEACYTSSSDIAYCSASSTAGWAVFTTTYTTTGLQVGTSTYSSYTAVTTSSGTAAICDTSLGQTSCGSICCASNQMCEYSGQCTGRTSLWTYTTTTSGSYSAPLRPTSGGSTTVSATTTEPFIPPATASGSTLPLTGASSHNLSAGAIAGIVIGTILGVILLLLLCFCCVVKGLWDSVLGIFAGGGGRRSRRQEGGAVRTRIETVERYSRHSRHGSVAGGAAAAAHREQQTGFFGGARADKPMRVVETRKKSSGMGGMGAMGAGLVGMAAMLGLKKKHDERRDEKMRPGPTATETDIGSTYYTDSYTATSVSSESSDRRSRSPRRDRSARR